MSKDVLEGKVDMFRIFRKNCQLLMVQNDFTAKQLSEKLGWYAGRVGNIVIKNGHHKPTSAEIIQLANELNVSIDDLVLREAKVIFH